jgi:hypothetical protein
MKTFTSSLALLSAVAGCGGVASTASDPAAPYVPASPSQSPSPSQPVDSASTPGWSPIDAGGDVGALITTRGDVCWTSFRSGNPSSSLVACAAKSDGHRTEFLRDGLVHPSLAASGTDLFWSTEMTATIDRAPLGGGEPTPVVTTKGPHDRFLLLRGTLYWLVDGGSGSILFAAGTDGAPSEVANVGPSDPDLLAIEEYSVYDYARAFVFGNGVQRLRLGSTDPPEQVAGNCFYPLDLVASGGFVLWSCEDRTIHWAPEMGGAEHVEPNAGGYLATWQGLAYAADEVGGRVLRIDPTTNAVDVLQTGLSRPSRIAVDDSGVYVADGTTIQRFSP